MNLNINKKIEKYISLHSSEEDRILKELRRETHLKVLHSRMLSGHLQGSFLAMLVKMIQPGLVLEVGTYTGYAAISMAKALPKGALLHTVDINDELESFTRRYFEKAGVTDKIRYHIGDALNIISQIEGIFDLVFIDADKAEYIDYYELAFPKLRKGGFIVADNALWDGKVVKRVTKNDIQTKGIIDFNRHVQFDDRVENILIPIRDGLMIIRKK